MSKTIKILTKTENGIDLTSSITNYVVEDSEDIKTITIILNEEQLLHNINQKNEIASNFNIVESVSYSNVFKNIVDSGEQLSSSVSKIYDDHRTSNPPVISQSRYITSIDPRFIFAVDQKIIELIAIPNEESDLNNFKNKYKIDAETWVKIKELKNEFNNEKTNLEKAKPNCPSCEVGALNRKYITKLLPYLESEVGNKFLEDLDTLFLKYHQGVDLETLKLNFKETKALLQQMDEELKNQTKDGKSCSTCAMNSLKNKYLQLSKGIFKKAEKRT